MVVRSVLLAAGRGERARPLTDHLPKPALPLLDVPLGAFPLPSLVRDFPVVVLNVRHLAEAVTHALSPFWGSDGRVDVLIEKPEAYGTAGTIAAVLDRVETKLVTRNSDLLADLDPLSLVAAHDAAGRPGTVAVASVERGADFVLEGGGIVRFVDRRRRPDEPGYRFLGAAVFERESLEDLLPKTRPVGVAEVLLAPLAAQGALTAHIHRGYWRDLATPLDYLEASLDVLTGVAPAPPGGVPGDVVDVKGGLAYLGPGASAPRGSLAAGAVVLAGAEISPDANVERSIVWPREHVPPGARVRDAIWIGGRPLPVPPTALPG